MFYAWMGWLMQVPIRGPHHPQDGSAPIYISSPLRRGVAAAQDCGIEMFLARHCKFGLQIVNQSFGTTFRSLLTIRTARTAEYLDFRPSEGLHSNKNVTPPPRATLHGQYFVGALFDGCHVSLPEGTQKEDEDD